MDAKHFVQPAKGAGVVAVIVTHNGEQLISRCLDSLRAQSIPVKAIVIDNASVDGTRNQVLRYENAALFACHRNVGFGRACNVGIKLALEMGAEFVLLLNQDAWLDPDAVGALRECAESSNNAAIVSPVHVRGDGGGFDSQFERYIHSFSHDRSMFWDLYRSELGGSYELDYMNAAAWLMTRAGLLEVGGFDPEFFMYSEDVDYCRRVREKGFSILVVPKAVAYHARAGWRTSGGGRTELLKRRYRRDRSDLVKLLKRGKPNLLAGVRLVLAHVGCAVWERGVLGDLVGLTAMCGAVVAIAMRLRAVSRSRRSEKAIGPIWLERTESVELIRPGWMHSG